MSSHDDPFLDRVRAIVDEHGWLVQGVFPTYDDPPGTVPFAYTVGLARHGKPELIIFGAGWEQMAGILNLVAGRALDGVDYTDGLRLHHVLQDHPVRLVVVPDSRQHLTVANTLAHLEGWWTSQAPLPALQVVWPDPHDRFPWDSGYAYELGRQPVLGAASVTDD
jgi:hypothetical protein